MLPAPGTCRLRMVRLLCRATGAWYGAAGGVPGARRGGAVDGVARARTRRRRDKGGSVELGGVDLHESASPSNAPRP